MNINVHLAALSLNFFSFYIRIETTLVFLFSISLSSCSQIDLREEKAKKLLTCHKYKLNTGKPSQTRSIRLHSIVMDPIDLNYFAVGGSDQYARVYDIRRLNASGLIMEDQPVETYTPKHLQGLGNALQTPNDCNL